MNMYVVRKVCCLQFFSANNVDILRRRYCFVTQEEVEDEECESDDFGGFRGDTHP
jgi:hypothetical protein